MTPATASGNPSTTGTERGRRGEVLAMLRASPTAVSIAELATRLRVHPNTVRFHLEALVEAGQAERVEVTRTVPGRPPQMFRAHRGMDPAGPRNYRLLAEILTAHLAIEPDSAARATDAGRAWGRRAARDLDAGPPSAEQAIGDLVRVLDEAGFDPEPEAEGDRPRIRLRHCPFLDLAEIRASVVCPLHLGLMQGVLEARTAPVTVTGLEPFAAPDLCLAHLATTSTSDTTDPAPAGVGR
ncbi:helix-turn-helix transcriptional regulator [Nocardia vaccinii]|uniref:helix-turn-helix transcriptional regulator n=1 Tax=Nocardia vaccinii TaxID=1822 RepID=UPI0008347E03|nr:helix-turn-helix domain-containing protein [Nocardia vaccinii]